MLRILILSFFLPISLVSAHPLDTAATTVPPQAKVRKWSVILPDDFVGNLLTGMTVVDDLRAMEAQGLTKASLPTIPWSDSYWPTMYGGPAWRYNDPAFPKSPDFSVNHAYFKANPPSSLLGSWAGPAAIDQMSPAEKYDLLVGDKNWTLTQANWNSGLRRMKDFGKVLNWEGFCHGWAVAAFSQDEPRHAVSARSVSGELIQFYPSDIKALTTLLYAQGEMPIEFIGTKCFDEKPREDQIGRNVQDECLSTNPGTWHVGIVSRLGVAKESFVIDITYDQAIWNQPVLAYEYSYFNPRTLEVSNRLSDAAVPVSQFPRDKFKKYRAKGTAFVVGINMDLSYSRENHPAIGDHTAEPATNTVRYAYDLELDANGKILGGEWYTKVHPDFVWAPARGAHPRSTGESQLGLETVWNPTGPVPAELLRAARLSSTRNQPVFGIVKGLIDHSKAREVRP